jgi:hypothetical protein
LGQPIPPPRLTFAHKKFDGYVRALGLKTEKNGTKVRLIPMLDKETAKGWGGRESIGGSPRGMQMSEGDVARAARVVAELVTKVG